MRRLAGFTLIELLIVIAVIAILVGITVPRFLGMRDEANTAVAAGETAALKAAVEAYRIHHGVFPDDANADDWQDELVATSPQLIESELIDPFSNTGVEYKFDTDGGGEFYVIWSDGPDGTSTITGISSATGVIAGTIGDDVYATNGTKP
ncbi:MAG: type II secretion system GspH family protein [Candidatus Omnitrophica bacterium]|nr:type II secretion system GspH family protein [Candidatus Omnitrophota bacterium]